MSPTGVLCGHRQVDSWGGNGVLDHRRTEFEYEQLGERERAWCYGITSDEIMGNVYIKKISQ
jgi:hypothetical protein